MSEANVSLTTSFLETAMGFRHLGTENGWMRYGMGKGNLAST